MSILVVDDDSTYKFLIQRAFSKEQMTALLRTAETGAETREAFEAEAPALVLLDVNLPDASGIDVLGWIRERSRVPVLMHSWSSRPEEVAAAYAAGANGYVEKQASFEKLRSLIRNLNDYWLTQNRT